MQLKYAVAYLGTTTSNIPSVWRDGGGFGKIREQGLMWFSDGIKTNDNAFPKNDSSNFVNFTSNSIACSTCDSNGITSLQDYSTDPRKGPNQAIPYFYGSGEGELVTGIWPNNNLVTSCGGDCAVGFPRVVNRTALRMNLPADMYNTAVKVSSLGPDGPVVTRPVQSLFMGHEPPYGSFSALAGIDGYIYSFAHITETPKSNGLKLARVPQNNYFERSAYQFWDGQSWSNNIPAYDDNGKANAFNWSSPQVGNGKDYGPGSGDVFYSQLYGQYMLIFQSAASAIDNSAYASYSASMTGPWSEPEVIYKLQPAEGLGYTYALHATTNYDETGREVVLSWTQFTYPSGFEIAMANVTFS